MHGKDRRAGGIVARVLAGTLVALVLLAGAVILFGLYFAHNVRVEESGTQQGKTVRVETPLGSMRFREQAKRVDPKNLGLPVYPGATLAPGPGKAINLEFNFWGVGRQFDVEAAELSTTDPVSKVSEFYAKECPLWSFSSKGDGSVEIKYSEGGYKRIVSIREEAGRTRITLARAGEPAAN